jgi:probable rRNA maturation factor
VSVEVVVQYAARKPWAPPRKQIARWVRAALGRRRGAWSLGVRVVGRAESRRVNYRYRHRDRATNVLSFNATVPEADGRRLLGDLVVCAPVIAREAREQGKSRTAHWAHMIVHGTLHLRGYDHERDTDARRMERRERTILDHLGYADPYEATH